MTLEYDVRVAEHSHKILIEVPAWCDRKDLKDVREFAISTALLEHVGYLPHGAVHAVV